MKCEVLRLLRKWEVNSVSRRIKEEISIFSFKVNV